MKKPFSLNRVEYGYDANNIDDVFLTIPFSRYDKRVNRYGEQIQGELPYCIWDLVSNEKLNRGLFTYHEANAVVKAMNDEFNFYINNLYAYLQGKDFLAVYDYENNTLST